MKKFLKQMVSAASGNISSKRVMGCIGFIVVLVELIYCTATGNKSPEFTEFLIGAIVALLGVDSVASIFKK